MTKTVPMPSLKQLNNARRAFAQNEPRGLFYRAATELVNLASKGATSLTVAESLTLLLQTWNNSFYRFHKFDSRHLGKIERLLRTHRKMVNSVKLKSIEDFCDGDVRSVTAVFQSFENVLGPVGAAKCLHLL